MITASLGMSIVTVALPALTERFDEPVSTVQWALLAYMLVMTVAIVGAGRLGDMLGRRHLLIAGVCVFTLGATLSALAPSIGVLIAARAIQGTGAAFLVALTMAVAREAIPEQRTGLAMGLLGASSAIGTALGPSAGGLLIAGFGWQAIFIVMIPLGVLTALLLHKGLPREQAAASAQSSRVLQYDWLGTLVLAATLAAFSLAMTNGGPQAFGLMAVALLAAFLFLAIERRSPSSLIPVTALGDATLIRSFLMNFLVAIVMMATLVVGPFFLIDGLGLGAAAMGIVMSTGPIVSVLTGIPAGKLTDRFGANIMTVVGLAQMLLGALGLVVLPAHFGLPGYVVAATLMPPGYQAFLAANNARVMNHAAPSERGLISGLLNLSRNLGLLTGTALMTFVFVAARGPAATQDTVRAAFQTTFGLAALMVAAATGLAVFALVSKSSSDRYRPVS
ncbi:MFS transporter [Cucumibacter marinus]|uniref:MFS transporter n=1 Tax=Cucumibacter marinus TaxID=1121252 RepID=UPI000405C95C|nr:MFS transporter [Cucumibacter marinus]